MFRASLAHHQKFRNCVCSQVSYAIILDSVFCLSCAVSLQGFVGPRLVCDRTPIQGGGGGEFKFINDGVGQQSL